VWITVPQLRVIFAWMLERRPTTLAGIVAEVNTVLRRTEEARIYHWVDATGEFPPSRREPDL
jgi:hypothetical protein